MYLKRKKVEKVKFKNNKYSTVITSVSNDFDVLNKPTIPRKLHFVKGIFHKAVLLERNNYSFLITTS